MQETNNNDLKVYELMVAVRKLTRTTLLHQHAIAESVGLHVTDAECIDFLQEMGPSTAGDLARVTGLTTGAITNVIDRLEKGGFVQRQADPADRRKVIVSLLPARHQAVKANYIRLAKNVERLFAGYNTRQLNFLLAHTRDLAQIYQGEIDAVEK